METDYNTICTEGKNSLSWIGVYDLFVLYCTLLSAFFGGYSKIFRSSSDTSNANSHNSSCQKIAVSRIA